MVQEVGGPPSSARTLPSTGRGSGSPRSLARSQPGAPARGSPCRGARSGQERPTRPIGISARRRRTRPRGSPPPPPPASSPSALRRHRISVRSSVVNSIAAGVAAAGVSIAKGVVGPPRRVLPAGSQRHGIDPRGAAGPACLAQSRAALDAGQRLVDHLDRGPERRGGGRSAAPFRRQGRPSCLPRGDRRAPAPPPSCAASPRSGGPPSGRCAAPASPKGGPAVRGPTGRGRSGALEIDAEGLQSSRLRAHSIVTARSLRIRRGPPSALPPSGRAAGTHGTISPSIRPTRNASPSSSFAARHSRERHSTETLWKTSLS